MPIQEALLKMSMYVSLVPIVPGPTNTLLLSSGLKVRLRGTWPLIVAEALGYPIAIAGWGFFQSALAAGRPWLYDAVKLASSVYIFFLALKMWTHKASWAARGASLRDAALRKPHRYDEPAVGRIGNLQRAAVMANEAVNDGQAQTAVRGAAASGIEPDKRTQHAIQIRLGYAGPVVSHHEFVVLAMRSRGDLHGRLAVGQRIFDEVREHAVDVDRG